MATLNDSSLAMRFADVAFSSCKFVFCCCNAASCCSNDAILSEAAAFCSISAVSRAESCAMLSSSLETFALSDLIDCSYRFTFAMSSSSTSTFGWLKSTKSKVTNKRDVPCYCTPATMFPAISQIQDPHSSSVAVWSVDIQIGRNRFV
jgi:hypothetical protein